MQDITEWNKDIDVDLIMHGSPCQDFSVAGKQAGGDVGSGTRSSLMYETIRIVGKLRPKYVVWENVKNLLSKKHKHNFDAYIETMNILGYNSYYQVLNAKDYGIPQNRERVFTISIRKDVLVYDDYNSNIRKDQDTIGTLTTNCGSSANRNGWKIVEINQGFQFPEKEPLKLRLKDMLEEQVDEKYYLSDVQVNKIQTSEFMQEKKRIQEKDYSDTILARDWKDPKCVQVGNLQGGKWDKINESCRRVYNEEGISPTVHTCQGGNTEPKVMIKIKNATKKGYDEVIDGDSINLSYPESTTRRGRVGHGVAQTLQCNDSMRVVLNPLKDKSPYGWHFEQNVYDVNGITRSIKAGGGSGNIPKAILEEPTIQVLGNYMPSNHDASRIVDSDGLAPTVKENHGTVTATVVGEKEYERTPLKFLNRNQKNIEGDYAFCVDSCNTGGVKEIEGNNLKIRKLTPKECWRLMGFDDSDFEKAKNALNEKFYKGKDKSSSQLYKQAGNSIVVNVLEKIFKNLLEE